MNRTKQARNELIMLKTNAYQMQSLQIVGDLKVSYGLKGYFITLVDANGTDKNCSDTAAERYLANLYTDAAKV